MGAHRPDLPELSGLGRHLLSARAERGYSQGRLAVECGLTQAQVSLFETGRRLPSLEQFVRIARTLDVPLQRLVGGADRAGTGLRDLAVELRRLGAADLWVADAVVPGSARGPEEVITLAISGGAPDPRVVETIPTLLSWNELNPVILRAHGIVTRTTRRLAWLADVALAIERQQGFPGGCRRGPLERFLKAVEPPGEGVAWDDLGRPGEGPAVSPLWRRWGISYGATLDDFERRATELASARVRAHTVPGAAGPVRRSRRGVAPPVVTAPVPDAAARATMPGARASRKGRSHGG
jgi:transcriptional regulator with XRE-family HTH domain